MSNLINKMFCIRRAQARFSRNLHFSRAEGDSIFPSYGASTTQHSSSLRFVEYNSLPSCTLLPSSLLCCFEPIQHKTPISLVTCSCRSFAFLCPLPSSNIFASLRCFGSTPAMATIQKRSPRRKDGQGRGPRNKNGGRGTGSSSWREVLETGSPSRREGRGMGSRSRGGRGMGSPSRKGGEGKGYFFEYHGDPPWRTKRVEVKAAAVFPYFTMESSDGFENRFIFRIEEEDLVSYLKKVKVLQKFLQEDEEMKSSRRRKKHLALLERSPRRAEKERKQMNDRERRKTDLLEMARAVEKRVLPPWKDCLKRHLANYSQPTLHGASPAPSSSSISSQASPTSSPPTPPSSPSLSSSQNTISVGPSSSTSVSSGPSSSIPPSSPPPPSSSPPLSCSVSPLHISSQPSTLMSYSNVNICDFGGRRESYDPSALHTAFRELQEEFCDYFSKDEIQDMMNNYETNYFARVCPGETSRHHRSGETNSSTSERSRPHPLQDTIVYIPAGAYMIFFYELNRKEMDRLVQHSNDIRKAIADGTTIGDICDELKSMTRSDDAASSQSVPLIDNEQVLSICNSILRLHEIGGGVISFSVDELLAIEANAKDLQNERLLKGEEYDQDARDGRKHTVPSAQLRLMCKYLLQVPNAADRMKDTKNEYIFHASLDR